MPTKLARAGVFRGTVVESALSLTKKGKYPQWVARLETTQWYVDDPDDMAHYELKESDWVDYDGEFITAYMVLYNSTTEFTEETQLLNCVQLCKAVDWTGESFDDLNNDSFVGKQILFRVEENEYEGRVSLQVNWVDDYDAPPVSELQKLSADQVKGLNKLLKVKKAKAKPTVAKPPSTKATTPKASPRLKTTPPKTTAPPSQSEVEVEVEAEAEAEAEDVGTDASTAIPNDLTEETAWQYVCNKQGDTSDKDLENQWIEAYEEVQETTGVSVDNFTSVEWAKVCEVVISDLALDA